ncbi:CDP-glycerol glycerophosphotransferase family protein [Peredibacter starrii]|uniref:CDP-glycerol glycerophosphotransferase family protein n=1 Tax=Peredibacter starrii TaxID=28202 RepID=A0AAX4HR23_9BACT|nr:CDP-glycerol glycerophosphotransferase family protein [Peredibacter starrii]WPU65818.1 CDP-glycerol glycerophosphotransferase family protein [Peredibacter starrii]
MKIKKTLHQFNSVLDTTNIGRAAKKKLKYIFQDLLREKPFWWNKILLENQRRKFCLDSGHRVKIVFLIHLPTSWTALKSIYEACVPNEKIDPILVLTPRRQNRFTDKWEGLIEAQTYFDCINIPYVVSCTKDYTEWLDLKALKPDVVFIQTPYEDQRHPLYKIGKLSKFTRVCYVPYAFILTAGTFEKDFYGTYFHRDCWRIFAESEYHKGKFAQYCDENRIIVTGYPKFDEYQELKSSEMETSSKTILWASHWTIQDEHFNASTFLKNYKYFLRFARENAHIKLIFRPHPFLFRALVEGKHFTEEQLNEFIKEWSDLPNTEIDKNPNYFEVFVRTDILVTDNGSFLGEYLLTGKPIIYTHNYKSDSFNLNDYGVQLTKFHYVARNVNQLEELINDIFLCGHDYLKEKRVENSKNLIHSSGEKAGDLIVRNIINEFLSKA